MEKYIVVGEVSFLGSKNFTRNFKHGKMEDVVAFCDDNYDREDSDLAIYPIEEFCNLLNEDRIDVDNSLFRYIEK